MIDLEKWSLYVFRATITNDGVTAGAHAYTLSPGVGRKMIILGGRVLNGSLAAVAFDVFLTDGTNRIYNFLPEGATIAAGVARSFPTSMSSADSDAGSQLSMMLGGAMTFEVDTGSIAISQDTAAAVIALVDSQEPTTATAVGPAGSTATINTSLVF